VWQVAHAIGLDGRLVMKAGSGLLGGPAEDVSVYYRFFSAVMLHQMLREVPLTAVGALKTARDQVA
jgi:hypothetical protein